MTTPIRGTDGKVTIGTGGDAKIFTWVGDWSIDVTNKIQTLGPYIGDPIEYKVATAQEWKFSVKGTIPSGGDAAQDALMAAVTGRTSPQLDLYAFNGKRVTFAASTIVYETLKISQAANGSHEFEATGSGPASLSSGAAS